MASSSQQNSTTGSTLGYKSAIAVLLCLQVMTVMWTSRQFGSNGSVTSQLEALFSLPSLQQRDCTPQENAPSSSTVTRHEEANVDNSISDPCSALMTRFHDINQHYREAEGDPATASPKPLINYAYYTGQGFGRLIDHTTAHCVIALHLGRPCVLDMSTRDPYFTWRSFIHMGSYNWEMQSGGGSNAHLLEDYYREEIDKAVSEMEEIGHGSWKNGVNGTYDKLFLIKDYPSNWPAKGKVSSLTDYDKNIEEWRNEKEKAIFSPNWGLWFPRLEFPLQPHGCPHLTELLTKMQNALWQPTPLTLHLHKLRATKVLSSSSSNGGNSTIITHAVAHKEAQRIPPPPPARTEAYGAIHIRTFFLKQGREGEWRLANLQSVLEKCLTPYKDLHGIQKWWILADKHEVAVELARNISTRFDIRHGYSLDDGFVDNNEHSRLPEAQAMLAHKLMAPSVLDWTVLHESKVALITSGSFGITGARGRGKYNRRTCDFFEAFY